MILIILRNVDRTFYFLLFFILFLYILIMHSVTVKKLYGAVTCQVYLLSVTYERANNLC